MSVIGGCVWSDVPKDAVYACGDGCPDGKLCRNGFCLTGDPNVIPDACTPVTCTQMQAMCGVISNGCGQILDCGKCSGADTCGGGPNGRPNQCGCTPLTKEVACQIADKNCGSITRFDGCGMMSVFRCGEDCGADGGCVGESTADLCGKATYTCGKLGVKDRCGNQRLVDCGSCGTGATCQIDEEISDGGKASTCGPCVPEGDGTLCNRVGASCGALPGSVMDNCGQPRTVSCGDCLDEVGNEVCGKSFANVCGCHAPLSGCTVDDQCCFGSVCGGNGMCCVKVNQQCSDDSDCCFGHCTGQPDAGAICVVLASTP